ncbi:phage tail protein [Antrihabitans sp. NCIMB 15449]|uniref:Phage tail protein n=1 Tax=Antrihabitans spumae TaxID=3373370 RepID=A0ABW7JMN9_9NOCA
MTAPTIPDWAHAETRQMDQLYLDDERTYRAPSAKVRFWSKFMDEEGVESNYLTLQHNEPVNKVGALAMTLPSDTQFYDLLFNNPDGEDVMIPITSDTPGQRWSGKVDRCALVQDENGLKTIEVSAMHDWQHVATTCLWASPWAPLYAQLPRHDVRIGPIKSICEGYLGSAIARQQMGIQQPYTNAPDDWADFGPAMWPIVVVPTNIFLDDSPWGGSSARFDMADKKIQELLKGSGYVLQVRMFLPEEDEQPAPEWFFLTRPTIVMKIVDKSNVTGPTGTILDGFARWFEDFSDDGTTAIRYPGLDAGVDYEQAYQTSASGTKRLYPWIWYFEGEYTGISQSELAIHKPMAQFIYVGGRSPSYINAAIEIAIKNALSYIGLLIGVPGLDALYRGQLDDVFLAFDVGADLGRIQRSGPFAWKDHFVTGSEKAFTIDGQMAKRQGIYDTRGYTSHKVSVEDFAPYVYGRDMEVGDAIGFRLENQIFVDYITDAVYTDNRTDPSFWTFDVGSGADEEDPVVKSWSRLGQIAQAVSVASKDVGMDADFFGLF